MATNANPTPTMQSSNNKTAKVPVYMVMLLFVVGVLVTAFNLPSESVDYPRRPISNIVVWSAGGGTDVANRMISGELARVLDVDINVSNKPGGIAGSLGLSYVKQRASDGYTLVGLSESCVTAAVMGGWDERMDVWYPFIIGGSVDLISVAKDSEINNIQELVSYAKENPGALKASAGGSGSLHHLNLLAFAKGTETELTFIPYPGSAPAQTAAITGEVDLVITSLAEQQQLIKSGQLRPLAMLGVDDFSDPDMGDIQSALKIFPTLQQHLPITQVIGLAIKDDASPEVKQLLTEAFEDALKSEKVQNWAKENYFVISGASGEAAKEEFRKLESLFAWTLQELGVTRRHPETLNIQRPN
ncbi:MAG: tripartite tricarboxylate transporter substrate binding protein [Lentimonas sp.]